MQTCLIVKEDGLIYVNRVPEEPHHFSSDYLELRKAQQDYEAALASAKENAVLCADQEQAKRLIWKEKTGLPFSNPTYFKPDIYSIPNVEWEVKDVPIERDPSTFTYYEREAGRQLVTEFTKVAILL